MRFRCPSCRDLFPMPKGEWPTSCPACGYDTSLPDTDEIALPAFLSPRAKNEDTLYRQVEAGSEERVRLAAEAAGCDASDMAGLKITNMQTGKGAGPLPVEVNPVTQRMAEMEARGMPTGFGAVNAGLNASGAVQAGPFPNAGANFMKAMQQVNPPAAHIPGIETLQPEYRRRA